VKTTFFTPDSARGGLRLVGFIVAVASVILPAFPLGPIATHPWTPLAVLWAAYGWASEVEEMERVDPLRGVRAPAILAALGLLQDQLSGGPLGLFMIVYLAAYLIGRVAAGAMRSPNVWSLWAGFIAMCVGLCGVVALIAPWALRGPLDITLFAQSCAVTAALFPLVRPLYMDVSTL
jgi:hypothetical protein